MTVITSISAAATTSSLYSQPTNPATGANTDATTMGTYTVSGGTLSSDGQYLVIKAGGVFGANTNTKQLEFNVGASTALDTTALAFNGLVWTIESVITRTGASAEKIKTTFTIRENAVVDSTVVDSYALDATLALDLSSDIVIALVGTNGTANANDIICNLFTVEKYG